MILKYQIQLANNKVSKYTQAWLTNGILKWKFRMSFDSFEERKVFEIAKTNAGIDFRECASIFIAQLEVEDVKV